VTGALAFVALAFALVKQMSGAWIAAVTVSGFFGLGALGVLIASLSGDLGLAPEILGKRPATALAGVTSLLLMTAFVSLIRGRAGRPKARADSLS
jgi:hypothetical protein